MRVRIRRFGTLRFPNEADLSVAVPSSSRVCSPLRCTLEFHSYPPTRAPPRRTSGAHDRDSRHALSLPFDPSRRERRTEVSLLVWPLLTSRSVVDNSPRRHPFKHEARSPQVRMMAFPAQPPDLHRPSVGRESFAVMGPLTLLGTASYPVSVRRLDGFATPLLSALPSRSAPCGSLRSLRPSSGRTFTSGPSPMLGTPKKSQR